MADATGLREHVRERYDAVFTEAARLVMNELQAVVPTGETGDTRRGLNVSVGGNGRTRFTADFRSMSPHGDYVEEGTRPHTITPRNARALRFMGGSGRVSQPSPNSRIATRSGGAVFAMRVDHPGTPARPWFRPVVARWSEFLDRAAATLA